MTFTRRPVAPRQHEQLTHPRTCRKQTAMAVAEAVGSLPPTRYPSLPYSANSGFPCNSNAVCLVQLLDQTRLQQPGEKQPSSGLLIADARGILTLLPHVAGLPKCPSPFATPATSWPRPASNWEPLTNWTKGTVAKTCCTNR